MTAAQREKLGLWTPQELQDVEKLVRIMPVIDVQAKAFTEGEAEMTSSDAITIQLRLKLTNLNEKEFPGYVHSNNYPYLKKQGWWVIISDMVKDRTILAHRVVFHDKKQMEIRVARQEDVDKEPLNEEVIEFRQRFGVANKFQFLATFVNDSYVGFDKEIPLEFEIVKDDPTRVIAEYSKEDVDALKKPGLFQLMLD